MGNVAFENYPSKVWKKLAVWTLCPWEPFFGWPRLQNVCIWEADVWTLDTPLEPQTFPWEPSSGTAFGTWSTRICCSSPWPLRAVVAASDGLWFLLLYSFGLYCSRGRGRAAVLSGRISLVDLSESVEKRWKRFKKSKVLIIPYCSHVI